MRSAKRAVIWTGIASVLTFLTCLAIFAMGWKASSPGNIIYDFSLACFGSAVLGVIVALTSYTTERQSAMESFYEEAVRAYNIIAVFPDMGIMMKRELELLCEYYRRIETGEEVDETLSELRLWYTENGQKLLKKDRDDDPQFESTDIRDAFVAKKMERLPQLYEDIKQAAKIVVRYKDYDLIGLHQAYGRLDFFDNLELRVNCADQIYRQLNGVKEYSLGNDEAYREYERSGKIADCCYSILYMNYFLFHQYYSKPPLIEGEMFKDIRKQINKFYGRIELQTPWKRFWKWIDKKAGLTEKQPESHPRNIGAREVYGDSGLLKIEDIRME